jgi:putative transposase
MALSQLDTHVLAFQRCWAHKTRNVLDKVKKRDREKVRKDLHMISHARTKRKARSAARRFAAKWADLYPKAVKCLAQDMDSLFQLLDMPENWRVACRTTNAIERRFREVRRRTRPMGVFSDRTSMERILFAVFSYENNKEGVAPVLLVTQNI